MAPTNPNQRLSTCSRLDQPGIAAPPPHRAFATLITTPYDSNRWSPTGAVDARHESEKKVARRMFEAALTAELAEIMAELKARAAAATQPDDMWSIQDHLYRKRREIDEKYDFRYSQLLLVFGRLLREGRIEQTQLVGLSEEKRSYIQRVALL